MTRILANTKALIFIIAVLLIANIAMLVFFTTMKPKAPTHGYNNRERETITGFLKYDVKFSQEQLKQYDSLKRAHWKGMRPIFRSLNTSKDSFYNHVSDPAIDSVQLRVLLDSIAIKQKMLDMQMLIHFRNTRNLCTPEQKPVYDSLVQNVIRRMLSPFRKPDNKQKKDDKPVRDKA